MIFLVCVCMCVFTGSVRADLPCDEEPRVSCLGRGWGGRGWTFGEVNPRRTNSQSLERVCIWVVRKRRMNNRCPSLPPGGGGGTQSVIPHQTVTLWMNFITGEKQNTHPTPELISSLMKTETLKKPPGLLINNITIQAEHVQISDLQNHTLHIEVSKHVLKTLSQISFTCIWIFWTGTAENRPVSGFDEQRQLYIPENAWCSTASCHHEGLSSHNQLVFCV